jgi:hypothetical protein
MDHLEPVRRQIATAPVTAAPAPWGHVATVAIGGLTEVGFGDDSDLLLVISSRGRGVFDCTRGLRVARDPEPLADDWYDERRLRARGIGPLERQMVRLAGLHGGGLPTCGLDGWSVAAITLAWPDQHLLLLPPGEDLYSARASLTKLAVESEVRAFGFSDTGRTLVLATSSDIAIYYAARGQHEP